MKEKCLTQSDSLCITSNHTMDRMTINLDDRLGAQLRAKAAHEKRSLSDMAGLIIAAHFEPAGEHQSAELRALGGNPEVAIKNAIAGLVHSDLSAPRE